jgi:hypothetical protein
MLAGCPTRYAIPSSSMRRRNQPIEPVASSPTTTGFESAP